MGKEFLREEMMFGEDALKKLRQSHVAVFGIGGVGSYSAEALARAGVGRLTLVDNDTVSVTNINRQLCALHSTVGQNKSDVMAQRILDINPECRVRSLVRSYTEADKELFFTEHYDYIIDAIDTVSCKLSLIENAINRDIPIISAMGTGNKLDPMQFCITDISKTTGCPLARVVRKELRARGINHHKVLYSQELPITPLPLEAPPEGRRSVPASVSWVPSCAGLMLSGFVVQQLIEDSAQ
ncbi:MAG: tRNA threonylcarbamoyladenosine dehydratase [Ruminococcaceae bacterium]|nr:tRNA threonylcarbamoyladenosine dehydratase [Oscillospiraceae bacterium]